MAPYKGVKMSKFSKNTTDSAHHQMKTAQRAETVSDAHRDQSRDIRARIAVIRRMSL